MLVVFCLGNFTITRRGTSDRSSGNVFKIEQIQNANGPELHQSQLIKSLNFMLEYLSLFIPFLISAISRRNPGSFSLPLRNVVHMDSGDTGYIAVVNNVFIENILNMC